MKIMVITSNRYNCLLPGFATQFNKHWSSNIQVDIAGDKPCDATLPDNFNFVHVGKDTGKDSWSNLMISYMDTVEDKYTMVFFDDHFIIGKIDLNTIDEALEIVDTNGYDKVWGGQMSRPYDVINEKFHFLNGYIATSFTPSIWKTSTFRGLLKPNLDCHTSEKEHGAVITGVKGISKCLIPTADVVRRSKLRELTSPWDYGSWRTGDGFSDQSDVDVYMQYQNVWSNYTKN